MAAIITHDSFRFACGARCGGSYIDASYIDTTDSPQLSRSAAPARKPLELVSFYEGNTPFQDVQRLKLRGFSRLEPAS